MNFKITACVVLYNPKQQQVQIALDYTKIFDFLYIVDNSPYPSIGAGDIDKYTEKMSYVFYGENIGLSKAYNLIARRSIGEEYDYLFLFDQDSTISESSINEIMSCVNSRKYKDVGIFCPVVYSDLEPNPLTITGENTEVSYVKWAINSGSCVSLNVWENVGGYSEKYFLDRVDSEYCYKLIQKNFKIAKVSSASLTQSFGQPSRFFNITIRQHDPIRHYYMSKSRMHFLLDDYVIQPDLLKYVILMVKISQHFAKAATESGRSAKFVCIFKGIKDYFKER